MSDRQGDEQEALRKKGQRGQVEGLRSGLGWSSCLFLVGGFKAQSRVVRVVLRA